MRLKRDSLDALFSNYIRERDNWTCQRCFAPYPPERRGGLHCAHIMSRRHKGLRYHPDNAVALCHGCHQYFTGYPLYFAVWVKQRIGKEKYDLLLMKARKPTKFTKGDLEMIKQDLKERLERVKKAHMNGQMFHEEPVL